MDKKINKTFKYLVGVMLIISFLQLLITTTINMYAAELYTNLARISSLNAIGWGIFVLIFLFLYFIIEIEGN